MTASARMLLTGRRAQLGLKIGLLLRPLSSSSTTSIIPTLISDNNHDNRKMRYKMTSTPTR